MVEKRKIMLRSVDSAEFLNAQPRIEAEAEKMRRAGEYTQIGRTIVHPPADYAPLTDPAGVTYTEQAHLDDRLVNSLILLFVGSLNGVGLALLIPMLIRWLWA